MATPSMDAQTLVRRHRVHECQAAACGQHVVAAQLQDGGFDLPVGNIEADHLRRTS